MSPRPAPPATLTEADCVRRYTRYGKFAHLLPYRGVTEAHILCRRRAVWPDRWLGDGGPLEQQYAALLPLCADCSARLMTPEGD
jgi:hypothetical protein